MSPGSGPGGVERRVLVTGASGFIGRRLVETLRTSAAVIGAGRGAPPPGFDGEWRALGAHPDVPRLREAMRGVDVVVHAAGRAHVRRETGDAESAYDVANAGLTGAVASAAADVGVRRLILLSSVAVYGARTGRVGAATPPSPVTPYGRSRLAGERAAEAVSRETGLECVTLRLPMVYGPGMKGNPLILFHAVDRLRVLPVGAIRNARSLLFVGNLAAAVRGLLDAQLPSKAVTLLAADLTPVSTPTLVREIADALGRRVRLVPVPATVLRVVARAGSAVAGHRFPLSRHAVQSLVSSLEIDPEELARVVGSPPPYSRREGLDETARWYMDEGRG